MVEEMLEGDSIEIDCLLPANRMDLVNLAYAQGQVKDVQFLPEGIRLRAVIPAKIAAAINS